ncbi:TPA: sigma-70 family RNA polymerase sigma factor, partial [Clostridium perfringens]|nr:sigma-70 family RNA polymerase sigma factor [Clostridium perfringens]
MSELYEKIKLCKLGNKDAIEEVVNSFEKTIVIELFKLKKENSNIYINEYDFQDNKSEVILNILKAIKNMPIEDFKYKTDEAVKKYI